MRCQTPSSEVIRCWHSNKGANGCFCMTEQNPCGPPRQHDHCSNSRRGPLGRVQRPTVSRGFSRPSKTMPSARRPGMHLPASKGTQYHGCLNERCGELEPNVSAVCPVSVCRLGRRYVSRAGLLLTIRCGFSYLVASAHFKDMDCF